MRKLKKLTDKQSLFIETFQKHGGNITKICNELKISTVQFNKYMQNEQIKEHINRNLESAREIIVNASPFLVNKALEMINDKNVNDKNKIVLINSLLDRAGIIEPKISPVSININTQISERARQLLSETITPAPPISTAKVE